MKPTSSHYLIGGGIGSMAAAFLIRDGGVSGDHVIILEANPLMGGSLDGAGDARRGDSLFPDRISNFVAKPMSECNGAEILKELCGHLRFDPEVMASANCIPCIISMFMPRHQGDRPLRVAERSKNFAFMSQFVEIPDDVVLTVEYSERAARMAVYQLLGIDREIPRVTRHDKSLHVQFEALVKAFK